jgi:subtilisin family serine protease
MRAYTRRRIIWLAIPTLWIACSTPLYAEVSTEAPDGFKLVSLIVVLDEGTSTDVLQQVPGGEIIHRYEKVFHGVSMLVPPGSTEDVSQLPGVKAVYPDVLLQRDTYRSVEFIGAATLWGALGGQTSAGEGVVVAVLDSGIWPENPAFSDPDPFRKPYAPPAGSELPCEFGNSDYNTNDAPFDCNNKLIGAYQLMDTYKALVGLEPYEFDSARDDDGHGTHTASTAAGNGDVPAAALGRNLDWITGVAPRAQIIAYKVCGEQGCYSSDSAAAVEQAITDGADVLNFSISGGANPYSDPVSLAFLNAYEAGMFVAASAGNSGPGANTVGHREPWAMTVAASTSDESYLSTVTLVANDKTLDLAGASMTEGLTPAAPVVVNSSDPLCQSPAPSGSFTGKIVVCQRGVNARVAKSANVAAGGAVGMLLYNATPLGTNSDLHTIPTVHLEALEGDQLLSFIGANPDVTATFPEGSPQPVQGDVMAGFSSRGGSGQTLGISKPDITAPGVNILAGYTGLEYGAPTGLFNFLSGTSMSSPHVAGAAALLKALRPDWSPGRIKSALMTTADASGVVLEDGSTPAGPFATGSGRVDLTRAGNAGITFDESADNYRVLSDRLWNANYPSLYHPAIPGQITVQRTIRNERKAAASWRLAVEAPADLIVTVPSRLQLTPLGARAFPITVDARRVPVGGTRHALLNLTNGGEVMRFPITVVRGNSAVALEQNCTPATLAPREATACTIRIENTAFEDAQVELNNQLPKNLRLVDGTIVGATRQGQGIAFSGTIAGAEPPIVSIATGSTPAGYVPLSAFGVAPIGGIGDESIVNFTVPAFSFAGKTYSRIGVVSNGYLVLGGGSGGDVEFVNQSLPDPAAPNNVLAPFWTDLNPGAEGAVRVGILSGGGDQWLVVDWEGVPEYSSNSKTASFQVWIGLQGDASPVEDITFAYGTIEGNGDGGLLTVGAENAFGNRGQNWYYNGTGSLPSAGTQLRVSSTPGGSGGTHLIEYSAVNHKPGDWLNCSELQSDAFQGKQTACVQGVNQ